MLILLVTIGATPDFVSSSWFIKTTNFYFLMGIKPKSYHKNGSEEHGGGG